MNTATVTTTFKDASGSLVVTTESISGDLTQDIEREDIAIGATNIEFGIVLDISTIQAIGFGISKSRGQESALTALATIKTNSSSTPDDTFTITATNGVCWINKPGVAANPFSADVTKIFVTNTGTGKIDFILRAVCDSTPGLAD